MIYNTMIFENLQGLGRFERMLFRQSVTTIVYDLWRSFEHLNFRQNARL